MVQRFRLLATLAGVALAACQISPSPWKERPTSHPPIATSARCNSAACDVTIDYERDGTDCASPYCYPVAPVHIIVDPSNAGAPPITMVWRLPPSSDATFASNGIHFKDPSSGFTCHPGTPTDPGNAHAFTCINRHLQPPPDPEEDGWKYSIRLDLRTGKLKVLDPWVVNR